MLNNDDQRINYPRRHDSQKQCSSGGAQHGVSQRKTNEVDHPFPNKPVLHRRQPKRQSSLGLDDFVKISISTQQRQKMLPEEYNSDVTRKTMESRNYFQRMPGGELEMTRAKEQDKLGKVEKGIINTMQNKRGDTETGDVFKGREERQHCQESKEEKAQKANTSYEDIVEAGWNGDCRIPRNEDPRTEDRMRKTYEVQEARWEVRKQEMESTPNKPTSLSNTTWTREGKLKQMAQNNPNSSGDEQNILQKSLHKHVHRMATETQGEERDLCKEQAPQLDLPCTICNRTFTSERLEEHTRICKKLKRSRPVYNISAYRMNRKI